jgi:hypothetical protein
MRSNPCYFPITFVHNRTFFHGFTAFSVALIVVLGYLDLNQYLPGSYVTSHERVPRRVDPQHSADVTRLEESITNCLMAVNQQSSHSSVVLR